MEIELNEISFGFEIVENLFQIIENEMIMNSFLRSIEKPKVEDVVPFIGGLPQIPLIVGLAGFLPDDINNLISKFAGYQSKSSKKLTEVIEELNRKEFYDYNGDVDTLQICVGIQIRWYGIQTNLIDRHGYISGFFINELKDKNITKEKLNILKLRFLRMTEKHKALILGKCNQKQRKMLGFS